MLKTDTMERARADEHFAYWRRLLVRSLYGMVIYASSPKTPFVIGITTEKTPSPR